jgi:excisionase family DNA binding protein
MLNSTEVWLDLRDAALLIGVSRRTIYRWLDEGCFPSLKTRRVGIIKKWQVEKASLLATCIVDQ